MTRITRPKTITFFLSLLVAAANIQPWLVYSTHVYILVNNKSIENALVCHKFSLPDGHSNKSGRASLKCKRQPLCPADESRWTLEMYNSKASSRRRHSVWISSRIVFVIGGNPCLHARCRDFRVCMRVYDCTCVSACVCVWNYRWHLRK